MSKQRLPWRPAEDALLRTLKREGLSLDVIAEQLNRSGAAVDNRWHILRNRKDSTEKPRPYLRRNKKN